MAIAPPLNQGWGYGIVLGLGALFALGMVSTASDIARKNRLTFEQVLVTWILKRYNHEVQTSEMFSTAGRTVKSGLVASAVVSSWTVSLQFVQNQALSKSNQLVLVGCNSITEFLCCLQLRCFWTFLVCQRCYSSDLTLCVHRHRVEEKSTKCPYFPRGYQGSFRNGHSFGIRRFRHYDQHSRHCHVVDRWCSCYQLPHRDEHCCGLLLAPNWCHYLHHVWRYQGNFPYRLCSHRHVVDHYYDLRVYYLCHQRSAWITKGCV
jgi:hypothetical protein